MKQKTIAFLFVSLISIIKVYSQESNPEKENEIRDYFWMNPPKEFAISAIPSKWSNESAVIIAKQIEFKVNRVGFSEKLSDQFYRHERIKLLDASAVKSYSEFRFGDNQKYASGLFTKASINIYLGIKIEKPNGAIEIVDMKDVVKNEIENGKQKYSIRKIAVPNLQVGDIIDYYFYREHNFRDGGFHEFQPRAIELTDEYSTLYQSIKLDLFDGCYLNTKSINGAPQLKLTTSGSTTQYEFNDSLREKVSDRLWINDAMQTPMVKFQVFHLPNSNAAQPGYESFFGPFVKAKNYVNVNELGILANNYKNAMCVSQGSILASVIKPTVQYLKTIDAQKPLDDNELLNEAFYFLREYWYQQRFFQHPQNYYLATSTPNDFQMTILLSNILSKLKREHEIVFIPTTDYTRDSDLLFINELQPGIKTIGDKSTIILGCSPNTRANELPSITSGVNGYRFKVNKTVAPGFDRIQLPIESATSNQTQITTEAVFNKQLSDSVTIKARFKITGSEKAGWDTVIYSPRIISNEFNSAKYGKYIKDRSSSLQDASSIKQKQQDSIDVEDLEHSRLERLKLKLQDYYDLNDIAIKSLNIVQYGRFDDQPEMIFDIEFTSGSLLSNAGDCSILAIGKLINHKEKITDKDRQQDIYLPYPYIIKNQIIITQTKGIKSDNLNQLNTNSSTNVLNFDTQASLSDNKLIITTTESAPFAIIPCTKWQEIIEGYNSVAEFNNKKIIIND